MIRELYHHWWVFWALWLYSAAVTPARAQEWEPARLGNAQQSDQAPPWCRVRCGDGSLGSGSLVDKNNGQGLAVTAFHVVRDVMRGTQQVAPVQCEFLDGSTYPANVVSFDETSDLCALVIRQPNAKAVMLAAYTGRDNYTVFGFAYGRQLTPVPGRIVDDRRFSLAPGGYAIAQLSAPSVEGQSGGAVATDAGQVGVMWGCDGASAQMTCGKPFDAFLVSLTQCYSCYGGQCWAPSQYYRPGGSAVAYSGSTKPIQSTPVVTQPVQPHPAPQPVAASFTDPKWVEWRAEIDSKLAAIQPCECDHLDYATKAELNLFVDKMGELVETNRDHAEVTQNNIAIMEALRARIAALEKKPDAPTPYKPPTPQQQAAAIEPYLSPLRLELKRPDGTTQVQERRLGGHLPLQIETSSLTNK